MGMFSNAINPVVKNQYVRSAAIGGAVSGITYSLGANMTNSPYKDIAIGAGASVALDLGVSMLTRRIRR